MTNTNSNNSNNQDDTLELPRRLTDEELDAIGEAIYKAILQSEGIHITVDIEATEVVDNTQQDDVQ